MANTGYKYTNDSILYFEYEETANKDPVSFYCHLYNGYGKYRILSKLSIFSYWHIFNFLTFIF